MRRKKTWLAGLLLTLDIAANSAPASAGIGISVDIGPPPARVVVEAPPPRSGYVWVPGYWDYDGGSYVWVDGHFEAERRGYRWRERRWVERDHHWQAEGGAWVHD